MPKSNISDFLPLGFLVERAEDPRYQSKFKHKKEPACCSRWEGSKGTNGSFPGVRGNNVFSHAEQAFPPSPEDPSGLSFFHRVTPCIELGLQARRDPIDIEKAHGVILYKGLGVSQGRVVNYDDSAFTIDLALIDGL